ncbi:MAG: hypothetical protein AB7G68_04865 [Nitrospiraceae bacterium]
MRIRTSWTAMAVLIGCLAGTLMIIAPQAARCAEGEDIIAQSPDYFPDAIGNRWQYRGQISEGPLQTVENKFFSNVSSVTGTKNLKSGTAVMVFHDTNPGNHGPSDSLYRRDAAGIVYYGSEPGTALERQLVPYQIVRFPMKMKSSFKQFDRADIDFGNDLDGDGSNERADVQGQATIVGQEAITVPAGSYPEAVKVEARMTLRIHLSSVKRSVVGTDVMTAWFVKGIGLVKYMERQELGALKEDRGLVTEIIEELEEFQVTPNSASLSRRETPPQGILTDYAGDHELQ